MKTNFKNLTIIMALLFVSTSIQLKAHELLTQENTAQSNVETAALIAKLESWKLSTEDNTKRIANNWDNQKDYYSTAQTKYNELKGQFYYTTRIMEELAGKGKRKQKKLRKAFDIDAEVAKLGSMVKEYNDYIVANDKEALMRSRGALLAIVPVVVGALPEIKALVDDAWDWINQLRDKNKEDFLNQLNEIRLKDWSSFYEES